MSLPWDDPNADITGDIHKTMQSAQEQPWQPFVEWEPPGIQTDSTPKGWRESDSDGVAVVSGGMDSITMVYKLVHEQDRHPHLLSFNYGQRHRKELDFALACAERLGLRWSLIDLSSITDLISNSALTSQSVLYLPEGEHKPDIDVPEGHYAEDNMALTVVPNRNMMMLSIAAAAAVNYKYHYVATGVHAGDHAQYPDCRNDFIMKTEQAIRSGNEGFLPEDFAILTPFIDKTKNDIAHDALFLDVPLHLTWSCYKGGLRHCGRCATCVERLEAVDSVHCPGWDKTEYDDTEYWKQVVADWKENH